MTSSAANLIHRCSWAEGDPLMRAYHDEEWGEYNRRAL
jgi:DNA-3-methyladenine glycosylase I